MSLTVEQLKEQWTRRVQRATAESAFVNTINLADRITIDFVWYPGARDLSYSLIDPIVPVPTWDETFVREIPYVWSRQGMPDVKRNMANGRVTLTLPPGSSGLLTVFDTQWKIVRKAPYNPIEAASSMLGVQRRLVALGYHLRAPGERTDGLNNSYGRRTERAVLAFQVDYRKPASAPAGSPTDPLHVRGEWAYNSDMTVAIALYNHLIGPTGIQVAETLNPSRVDGLLLQAALVAVMGS